jgi:hypothetical protein
VLEVGYLAAASQRLAPVLQTHTPGEQPKPAGDAPIGGRVLAGFTHAWRNPYLLQISVYMLLFTILSTFLYFQQAAIVGRSFADRTARTAFFARIDLMVNLLTLGAQFFLTGRVMKRAGVALTLTFVPALTAVGFLMVGFMPVAAIVVGSPYCGVRATFAFAQPSARCSSPCSPGRQIQDEEFHRYGGIPAGDQIGRGFRPDDVGGTRHGHRVDCGSVGVGLGCQRLAIGPQTGGEGPRTG